MRFIKKLHKNKAYRSRMAGADTHVLVSNQTEKKNSDSQRMIRLPGDSTLPRSTRGFSRKLQDMIKKESLCEDNDVGSSRQHTSVKFEPHNWKQLTDKQIAKLTPMQRSRYLAYESAPKEMVEKCQESLKRVRARKERERESNQGPSVREVIEYERNNELVGHLKSAEARHRIRLSRLYYQYNRDEELAHLISSQPSSIEAVRLQSFINPSRTKGGEVPADPLNRHQRIRCEVIMEDELGLTTNRT